MRANRSLRRRESISTFRNAPGTTGEGGRTAKRVCVQARMTIFISRRLSNAPNIKKLRLRSRPEQEVACAALLNERRFETYRLASRTLEASTLSRIRRFCQIVNGCRRGVIERELQRVN